MPRKPSPETELRRVKAELNQRRRQVAELRAERDHLAHKLRQHAADLAHANRRIDALLKLESDNG